MGYILYTVNFSASPSVGGTVTGKYESNPDTGTYTEFNSSQEFSEPHNLQFKATASSGYTFEKFTVTYNDTETSVTSNPFYKSDVKRNINVVAQFKKNTPPTTYMANIWAGTGGNISIDGETPSDYQYKTYTGSIQITLLAVPNAGYEFVKWVDLNEDVPSDVWGYNPNPTIGTPPNSSIGLTARFKRIPIFVYRDNEWKSAELKRYDGSNWSDADIKVYNGDWA